MLVRETRLEDVPGLATIRGLLQPWMVASLQSQQRWFTNPPPNSRALRVVAEVDGVIAGFGLAQLNTGSAEPNAGYGTVQVHPEYQRQGAGGALWERVSRHFQELGVRRAMGWGLDGPNVERWMTHRGIERGSSSRYSIVDPRQLPQMPLSPPGATLIPLAEAGPKVLHELSVAAMADEPSDMNFDGMSKTEFVARLWNNPDLHKEASLVALVDGVPAAFTMLDINGDRGWTSGTGTLRAFRGRGLSKLLKSVSLRKAASLGVTRAYTANAHANAPMLAVNDWLGYKVIATSWTYIKDFSHQE